MDKRHLKQKIIDSFRTETPDMQSRIISSCETEEQEEPDGKSPYLCLPKKHFFFSSVFKRSALAAACLLLFLFGFGLGVLVPDNSDAIIPPAPQSAETFVYLDVNPSIELRLNSENTVLECIAANADAKAIVSNLTLNNVNMNTALTAIVGSMYINGYLSTESNSILVSVDSSDVNKTDALLLSITESINTVFEKSELECSIIAQSLKVDDTLKNKAAENEISVGIREEASQEVP